MELPQSLCALVIGFVWGVTNPFIKTGSAKLSQKRGSSRSNGVFSELSLLLQTPSYLIPQLLNFGGAFAFAALLSVGELSIVAPIANGASLAVNTVVDLILGERYRYSYLLSGLICVAIGIVLCTVN